MLLCSVVFCCLVLLSFAVSCCFVVLLCFVVLCFVVLCINCCAVLCISLLCCALYFFVLTSTVSSLRNSLYLFNIYQHRPMKITPQVFSWNLTQNMKAILDGILILWAVHDEIDTETPSKVTFKL